MCLAQGSQRSDAGEARTRGPSISSQALYHWATALPGFRDRFLREYSNEALWPVNQLVWGLWHNVNTSEIFDTQFMTKIHQ